MKKCILFFIVGVGLGVAISTRNERNELPGNHLTISVTTDTLYIERPVPIERRITSEKIEIVTTDTVFVVDREEKVYTDSTSYRAVVSGYDVRLDTLSILHTTITRQPRRRHWGIGITAGMTCAPKGFSPGVTLGLTYMF